MEQIKQQNKRPVVVGIGEVTAQVDRPIPVEVLVPVDAELIAFVFGLTHLTPRYGVEITEYFGPVGTRHHNTVALVLEVVERDVQLAEERKVETDVEFLHALPVYVAGGVAVDCGAYRPILLRRRRSGVVTASAANDDLVEINEMARTVGIVEPVAAHDTVRTADFQEIDVIAERFPEFLVADGPADRYGGEELEAVAFGQTLRTVVSEIELGEVALVEIIGYTT